MTFQQKVREIVEKPILHRPYSLESAMQVVEETEKAILKAVEEIVPEKHDYEGCPYCIWPDACVSWDDYREELLRRINA